MLTSRSRGRPSTRLVVFQEPKGCCRRHRERLWRATGWDVNPATTGPFAQMVAKLFTIDNAGLSVGLDQLSGSQFAQLLQSQLYSLRPLNASITDRMDCDLSRYP